ncbi:MAG: 6-carboxytetrahydropterin synthase QueD [Bacteroidia bacterium]
MVIITKLFHFEAAHFLPKMPEGHKCRRMHGHSFNIEIKIAGEPDAETGLLMDFGDVKAIVKPYVEMLDHWVINEVGEQNNDELLKNPTSENIAKWFFLQLQDKLPMYSVIVHETCTSHCEYRAS